jgi:hypothetical protein
MSAITPVFLLRAALTSALKPVGKDKEGEEDEGGRGRGRKRTGGRGQEREDERGRGEEEEDRRERRPHRRRKGVRGAAGVQRGGIE